jgi:hypothetical protein
MGDALDLADACSRTLTSPPIQRIKSQAQTERQSSAAFRSDVALWHIAAETLRSGMSGAGES